MLCCVVSCRVVSCRVVSCRVVLCCAVLCRVVLCCVALCCVVFTYGRAGLAQPVVNFPFFGEQVRYVSTHMAFF